MNYDLVQDPGQGSGSDPGFLSLSVIELRLVDPHPVEQSSDPDPVLV